MQRKHTIFLLPLLAATLTMACTKQDDDPTPNDPGAGGQSGYLTGLVTDPQGNPLSRATVFINNTVFKGRGAEIVSAADGRYKLALVSGLGQWVAKGYLLKQYNGRVYKIELDPENPDSFSEDEKPVRNFQWKLTGHVPNLSLDLYYGGTAELLKDPNEDWSDTENVEFTFTPVGPLIDGSTGQPLKLRASNRSADAIRDIPMGRYKITAVYKPTGQALQVADGWGDLLYGSSVTLDFYGTEASYRRNQMGIAFRK